MIVVADTGAVLALLKRDDGWHRRVAEYWERHADAIRIPEPVLPEICYLLATQVGTHAETAFVRAAAEEDFVLESFLADVDLRRTGDLMETYHDVGLGFVDCAVTAIAERLEAATLLTTDRRHFPIIRPRHVPAFVLVP